MTTDAGRPVAGRVVSPRLALSPGDRLLAVGLCVLFEVPHFISSPGLLGGYGLTNAVAAVLGAVLTLSIAWRRRHPLTVLLITMGFGTLLLTAGNGADPLGFPHQIAASTLLVAPAMLVAVYTVARYGVALGKLTLGAAVLVLGLVVVWRVGSVQPYQGIGSGWGGNQWDVLRNGLVAVLALVTAWMLGDVVHARSETSAVRLAARHAEAAEHDRAVAAEERARIARELHDITAHHISVVTLQAGTARLLAETGHHPDADTLAAIETAARQAMIEIRQALGVIRSTPDGAAPLPGLAQLPELASRMGPAGLTVTITGDPGPLPGGLDLTAYRIVQEGLANVARHSAARTVEVAFHREAAALDIMITDAGPARPQLPAGAGGHGLVGVRERVHQYGGRLHAGPLPAGGFRLHATLPVPDQAANVLASYPVPELLR
ncbi:MAG TPA: histidine kinase [Pseudonocardiaceae bacterium]|nr:histidine kinase [Pseudonocardiaceae bacterium]